MWDKSKHYRLNVLPQHSSVRILLPPQCDGIRRWGLREVIRIKESYGFPGSAIKNLPANAEDAGLIPGSGRVLGEENGNPFQTSCLENPVGSGVLWATVHGVAKTGTQFSD